MLSFFCVVDVVFVVADVVVDVVGFVLLLLRLQLFRIEFVVVVGALLH